MVAKDEDKWPGVRNCSGARKVLNRRNAWKFQKTKAAIKISFTKVRRHLLMYINKEAIADNALEGQ